MPFLGEKKVASKYQSWDLSSNLVAPKPSLPTPVLWGLRLES